MEILCACVENRQAQQMYLKIEAAWNLRRRVLSLTNAFAFNLNISWLIPTLNLAYS